MGRMIETDDEAVGMPKLKQLMEDLATHHETAGSAPSGFVPRAGDLVSAKYA